MEQSSTQKKQMTPPVTERPLRLAVLLSGGGRTLANLLEKKSEGVLDIEVCHVVASRPGCGGIQIAKDANIPIDVVSRKLFESREAFSDATFQSAIDKNVDLVVMAGYLSLVTIPDALENRVMNIHPSLIPMFCGKGFHGRKVHEGVVERGVKITGCTVHFVDNQYDHGPILLQQSVAVTACDTADDVAEKVFTAECKAYPEAIRLFASGQLQIANGIVWKP